MTRYHDRATNRAGFSGRRGRLVAALVAVAGGVVIGTPALAADGGAAIEGGPDADGNLRWTVRNERDVPIDRIEFPHYLADVFEPPKGWEGHSTYLVNVGVPRKPGVCIATAEEGGGIPPGGSAVFFMRIKKNAGARFGTGSVKVHFADGKEIQVRNVQVTVEQGISEQYLLLVSMGALFAGWVIIRTLRRRRGPTAGPAEDLSPGPEL